MARPEQYGAVADGRTNCAEAINRAITETGSVELGEGVYLLGDTGTNNGVGTMRSVIQFGWNPPQQSNIRIIGAGPGKTILRAAPDTSAKRDSREAEGVFLIKTISAAYHAPNITNTRIAGITFDGNFDAGNQDKTMSGISVWGSGTVIEDCEFLGFGTGPANQESFIIWCGLATESPDQSQGPIVRRCHFHSPGRNSRKPTGSEHIEAVTYVSVGGNLEAAKFATGVRVENCLFEGDVNANTQTSPLHGVTPFGTMGAVITGNEFRAFAGTAFYVDTGVHIGTQMVGNRATECPNFVHLTSQNLFRFRPDPNLREYNSRTIARHVDMVIQGNTVTMSGPDSFFWQPTKPGWPPMFLSYQWDRDFGQYYREDNSGFVNVQYSTDGMTTQFLDRVLVNIGGYWPPAGGFRNGEPWGPVPPAAGIALIPPSGGITLPFWLALLFFL